MVQTRSRGHGLGCYACPRARACAYLLSPGSEKRRHCKSQEEATNNINYSPPECACGCTDLNVSNGATFDGSLPNFPQWNLAPTHTHMGTHARTYVRAHTTRILVRMVQRTISNVGFVYQHAGYSSLDLGVHAFVCVHTYTITYRHVWADAL